MEYTYAVRYEALNHPEADPTDPISWSEYVFISESLLDAVSQRDQWQAVYEDNDNIRALGVVYAPRVMWQPYGRNGNNENG